MSYTDWTVGISEDGAEVAFKFHRAGAEGRVTICTAWSADQVLAEGASIRNAADKDDPELGRQLAFERCLFELHARARQDRLDQQHQH